MNKDFYNASGCPDPTAYEAIQNVTRGKDDASANANHLIRLLKAIIAENGFVLLNRIEVKELKSGTVFK